MSHTPPSYTQIVVTHIEWPLSQSLGILCFIGQKFFLWGQACGTTPCYQMSACVFAHADRKEVRRTYGGEGGRKIEKDTER
jgi:hypothetical protein|eukprot:COSAG01_NODE_4880_length_4655_cov_16.206980_2_plen_81_part_00